MAWLGVLGASCGDLWVRRRGPPSHLPHPDPDAEPQQHTIFLSICEPPPSQSTFQLNNLRNLDISGPTKYVSDGAGLVEGRGGGWELWEWEGGPGRPEGDWREGGTWGSIEALVCFRVLGTSSTLLKDSWDTFCSIGDDFCTFGFFR